jgi:hypothetical protein
MKKLTLTIGAVLAFAVASQAQGLVAWQSISAAAMTAQTNSTVYSPLFGGGSTGSGAVGATGSALTASDTATPATGYYYELLYTTYSGTQAAVPGSVSALLGWSDTSLTASNSPTASRLIVAANQSSGSAVVPWASGTTDSIVLVGWSANLGSSWNVVSNELAQWTTGADYSTTIVGSAFLGISATGYVNPALSPASGVTLFATAAGSQGLPIYSLNTQLYLLPVPEPATLALAGLGGLGLLLFRRRRQ